MVKRISTFILSLVLLFSAICSAEATDVFGEGLTVYASKEEQETVASTLISCSEKSKSAVGV
jgi:hypothetical protein